MGSPPPTDYPTPEEQDVVDASASFEPSPSGATLCGFALPTFNFSLGLRLPAFPPFPFPPKFNFALALNCDLSDPFTASVGFGGGRVSAGPNPDDDPEFSL